MRVSDENVGHRFAAHSVKQSGDMARIVRAGIDDRHLVATNDITHRPLEGERARIIGHYAPQAGHRLVYLAGCKI